MSCESVQKLVSPLLDGKLAPGEKVNVLAHIGSCRKCGAYMESIEQLQTALRGMSRPAMPEALAAQLKVLASHEHARRVAAASFAARWNEWRADVRLWFDNLMRPVALPAAGGLLSAMLLFAVLLPILSFSHNFADQAFLTSPEGRVGAESSDGFYEPASYGEILQILPSQARSSDFANVVWLTVDENGKVVDYSIERGNLTPDLQSIILFSQFIPATVLGLPTSGRVRVAQQQPLLPARRSLRS